MVETRPLKATVPRTYRKILSATGTPPDVLVSNHAVPAPEMYADPIARSRETFAAIRTGLSGIGLEVGILPTGGTRKDPAFVWGDEAERVIEARLRVVPDNQEGDADSAWPAGLALWRSDDQATYVAVLSDWDCITAKEIFAWGVDAEAALGVVEAALDTEALWA